MNVVTLGCSKNVVDSEVFNETTMKLDGLECCIMIQMMNLIQILLIINTCGFITDAKEESIDTILRFTNAKKKGIIDCVYVMGCLSQRYKTDLTNEIPEVDGIYGVSDMPIILKKSTNKIQGKQYCQTTSYYSESIMPILRYPKDAIGDVIIVAITTY
ncbi:MAG: hypothetical protein MZV63_41765 [Marinilabiliales bacterium]|nr:hypothetical protein [Marinilabiliales bacterium]